MPLFLPMFLLAAARSSDSAQPRNVPQANEVLYIRHSAPNIAAGDVVAQGSQNGKFNLRRMTEQRLSKK